MDDDLVVPAEPRSVSSGEAKCSDPGMWAARYSQSPNAFTSFRGSPRSSFFLSAWRGDQSHVHPSSRSDEGESEVMQVKADRHRHRSALAAARAAPRVASS